MTSEEFLGRESNFRPTIIVPKPSDSRYGFLSMSSHHPFTLEDKVWPSISHFMLGKQFEGTMLENEIRSAGNVVLAKLITTRRSCIFQEDGRPVKKTVYGLKPNLGYEIRTDWSRVKLEYLEMGIRAKFDQNPRLMRKLLETNGMIIVDRETPEAGEILVRLRKELSDTASRKSRGGKKISSLSFPLVDLKTETLTTEEDHLITTIITITEWIREIEGIEIIYPEMFEDAVINLLPESISGVVMVAIKGWVQEMLPEWSSLIGHLPRFEKVVKMVERRINHILPTLGENTTIQAAIFIASFIKWLKTDAENTEVVSILGKGKLRKGNIFIPPIARSYRKDTPVKLINRRPKPPPVREVVPKKIKSRSEMFSLKRLVVDSKSNLRMSSKRGKVILRGDDLPKYRPQLLAIGGRTKGRGAVSIPRSSHRSAEEIFFNEVPKESRVVSAYRSWWYARIGVLIDTAKRVAELINRSLNSKIMGMVIRDIYGFQPTEFRDGIYLSMAELEGDKPKYKLSPKILAEVSSIGNISNSARDALLGELSYGEYFSIFDRDRGWKRDRPKPSLSRHFTDIRISVLTALKNIVNSVTDPGKGIGYPLGIESVTWAFLTLVPKNIRRDAEVYARSAFKDYVEDFDRESAEKHLRGLKIYANLQTIEDVLYLSKKRSSIPVIELVIMGVALTFVERRGDGMFEERAIMMRGREEDVPAMLEIDTLALDQGSSTIVEPDIPIEVGHDLEVEDSKWIMVIANATSTKDPSPKTPSEMATRDVYDAYPYANVYRGGILREVGDVIVSIPHDIVTSLPLASTIDHRPIITVVAEHSLGGPKKIEDTIENRKGWFLKSLERVSSVLNGDSVLIQGMSEEYRNELKKAGIKFNTGDILKKEGLSHKVNPSFNGEIIRPPDIKVESKDRPNPSEGDTLDDDMSRGALYIKTFKPHKLPGVEYSKLVAHLESTPKKRRGWLERFMEMNKEEQAREIKMILDG
jgi:predicted NAD-dependent protein-ADP-ribosyltransferase YbiA (DUF1768 family)